jgi:histidyl-tRNA synthetase
VFERPRGTRDFNPLQAASHRFVDQAFRRTAEAFGFREVLTPTFENVELFKAKSGPGILEEMFTFKDKGGRDLALRPEFTASIIRFYNAELRSEPKPLKVFTLGNCFRYEEPQMGRYREFWQWNCEIIGAPSLESDSDVIALADAGLKQVGLKKTELRIGHIGMLRKFLAFPPQDQAALLHLLDKKRFADLRTTLTQIGGGDLYDVVSAVAQLKGGPEVLDRAQSLIGQAANESVDYLRKLGGQLALYGIKDFVYDLGIVRGLDYYTGMVFEIDSPNLGAEKQVGGGGAYTLTDVLGGEATSSTGFAIGMDRVVLSAGQEGVKMAPRALDAYIIPIGQSMRTKAFEIVMHLRMAGLCADVDLMGRGPSKNLDYANSVKARTSVLIGEKEAAKGVVALRDMESGKQTEVSVQDLIVTLKGGGEPKAQKANVKPRQRPKKPKVFSPE